MKQVITIPWWTGACEYRYTREYEESKQNIIHHTRFVVEEAEKILANYNDKKPMTVNAIQRKAKRDGWEKFAEFAKEQRKKWRRYKKKRFLANAQQQCDMFSNLLQTPVVLDLSKSADDANSDMYSIEYWSWEEEENEREEKEIALTAGKKKAKNIIEEVVGSLPPFPSPSVKIIKQADNTCLSYQSISQLEENKKKSIQWTEKTRMQLHQAVSLLSSTITLPGESYSTQVAKLQEKYLIENPHLDDEFKWQQSKVDIESITTIVKTQINVHQKKKTNTKLIFGDLIADANCCKPIIDHIEKLKYVCIRQDLLRHRHLKNEDRRWIKALLELEEKVKNGSFCFPTQRDDLQFLPPANYEEPDSDHLLLLKLYNEGTNLVTIDVPDFGGMVGSQLFRVLLLRSLLVRHVRRYHKLLDIKFTEYEKFLGSDRYIQMHQLKEECIKHGLLKYAKPEDTIKRDKYTWVYSAAPMNKYAGANKSEWNKIMSVLQRCLKLSPKIKAEQEAIRERELKERKAKLVAAEVIIINGEFGDLYIPLPADRTSNVYRKSEAAFIVTAQSFKRTADRRTLIECIANEQYVSSSRALYDVIQRFENGESILDDKWARGEQWNFNICTDNKDYFTKQNVEMPKSMAPVTDITQLIPKSYIKPNGTNNNYVYFKSGKRSASIILQATPFTFRHQEWRDSTVYKGQALYPDISNPSDINIFDFIGNVPKQTWGDIYGNEEQFEFHKVNRLYFSTTEFPPPSPPEVEFAADLTYQDSRDLLGELGVVQTIYYNDLREEQLYEASLPPQCDASTLAKLTNYIKSKSIECGSPVICTISKSYKRIFQCQHCHRLPNHKCISFDVRWDKFGFYVHLLDSQNRQQAVGEMSHHPDCVIPEEIAKRKFVDCLHEEDSSPDYLVNNEIRYGPLVECYMGGCTSLLPMTSCNNKKLCALHEKAKVCVGCQKWFTHTRFCDKCEKLDLWPYTFGDQFSL